MEQSADDLDRTTQVTTSSGDVYTYTYNGEGQLHEVRDNNGTTNTADDIYYRYVYDELGRLSSCVELTKDTDGDPIPSVSGNYVYDIHSRLKEQTWAFPDVSYTEEFTYDTHGRLTSMRTGTDENNSTLISLAYDTLSRLYTVTTPVQQTTYSHTAGATTGTTTGLVSQMTLGKVNSNSFTPVTFGYEYDVVGNISKITESGVGYTDYTYDTVNQLLSAKDYNTAGTLVKEYTYTYDTYGNIRTASDGTTSHTYTYGDNEWLDLLTAYDGNAITYDTAGNPLTYHDGTTFTWRNGRELATLTKNGQTISYAYDQGGVRTTKTAGSVTHKYYYASGKLLRETWTQDSTDYVLDFLYNQNGSPYALKYTAGTAATVTYYYVLNLQGDVIRLVDSTGATVASYDYDPWGKILSVADASGNAITSTTHIANVNPLRYRGYYYDAETGVYYLQSRYYDPNIGRFINADSYASTGAGYLGYNMFAYCSNNAICATDPSGATEEGTSIKNGSSNLSAMMLLFGAAACLAKSNIQTKTKPSIKDSENHSVYVLIDTDGEIKYVGRTVNVKARSEAHDKAEDKKDLEMVVLFQDLNYYQARGLEQIFMIEAHTKKDFGGLNLINGVSPKNPHAKWYMFNGIAYLENQVSNEVLYWLERIGG